MTPLQWIGCTGRYKDVCRYLMAQGAKYEVSDVFWACVLRRHSGGQAIARIGSRPRDKASRPPGPGVPSSSVGHTPLHQAAIRGESAFCDSAA